jgi:glycosyltransferase involved in cell wall biosynthesis
MRRDAFVFVSMMTSDPWGGSEELWSRAALNLVAEGYHVIASVREWRPLHKRVVALRESGVDVSVRPLQFKFWELAWRKMTLKHRVGIMAHVEPLLDQKRPCLVVISSGHPFPPIALVEHCVSRRIPFVTIGQSNHESWWPEDDDAKRYRDALPAARRCYFASKATLRLVEKQIGLRLSNAEAIWNPVNVEFEVAPVWPVYNDGEVRFACVGRLHPPSKGQDILLEALATPIWAERKWHLTIFGEGRMKGAIERMVQDLGLSTRVTFVGHALIEDIWASNHVLVMPSRYEGLPLVIIEAMLCGRPVVATDVAGHSEVVEDGTTGFLADAPTVPSFAKALDRFWARRGEAEQIGKLAAAKIRQIMPIDPARIFSDRLKLFAKRDQ